MPIHSVSGQLRPTPPFDFGKSLDFLGLFPPTKDEQTLTGRSLTKAARINGQTLVFQIRAAGSVERPLLEYTLFAGRPIGAEMQEAALDRISFFLSLADELQLFYAIGRRDPAFAPIVEQLYGYHQVKFLTPFENACWAVLTQRNRLPVARKMKQALVMRFGHSLTVNGSRYWAFPEPAQWVDVEPHELAPLVRNQQKAAYLVDVAAAFNRTGEEFMRTAPYEVVEQWLQSIKGIGAWSAAFVLIRGLGRVERVTFVEKALLKAIAHVYGPAQAQPESARRIADKYDPWQGYWAHYLRAASE